MNEHDWLLAIDPAVMLGYLSANVSPRKLRLFACACVRHRWDQLRYPIPRQSVELAERMAEGTATTEEVEAMRAQAAISVGNAPEFEREAYQAAAATLDELPMTAAQSACTHILNQRILEEANAAISRADEVRIISEATAAENLVLGRIVHEIFGNPFRTVTIDPTWLRWSDGAVLAMARFIEQEQRLEELPYLADALLDAGCMEEELLRHLREGGPHRRGCWALDAILGR